MAPAADVDLFDTPAETFPGLPLFADTVPTAPLLRISLFKLAIGDVDEQNRLWDACRQLGFFYMDMRMPNTGAVNVGGEKGNIIDGEAILTEKDQLFELMKDMWALPNDEKQKYDRSDQGNYFGSVSILQYKIYPDTI